MSKFLKNWRYPISLLCLALSILACTRSQTTIQTTNTAHPPTTTASTPTFTPIPLSQIVVMAANPTTESGKSPDYTVDAQTPFLQRSDDQRVVNFNNEMAQLTQEEIAKFKDNVAQTQPIPGLAGSSYKQSFKVLSKPGNLVSLKFDISIYIEGAAHPNMHNRTITYDLEAGSDLKLSQLFLPNADYLTQIANYCIAQLKTRAIDFAANSAGAQPLPQNYGNWNVTPDGLLITFDEYQVAAYAAGPQEVYIPFSELSAIIDPNGPLVDYLTK